MSAEFKKPLIISSVQEMISYREKLNEATITQKSFKLGCHDTNKSLLTDDSLSADKKIPSAESKLIRQNLSVGFVPTMGALHQGHASLLARSHKENDLTILSIFVNPTQFNDKNDFEKYPKTFAADFEVAQKHGVDVIFCPQYSELYPDDYKYKISESDFSLELCGASRKGHFDGVLSIVMKLFQIIKPTKSYFGEKDYQQLMLIKGMVQAFFMPLEIVAVPTLREDSGLAMSSRNTRLSSEGQAQAALIYKTITKIKDINEAKEILTQKGFDVDYLVDKNGRRFVAAFLEGVRLIDNVKIP